MMMLIMMAVEDGRIKLISSEALVLEVHRNPHPQKRAKQQLPITLAKVSSNEAIQIPINADRLIVCIFNTCTCMVKTLHSNVSVVWIVFSCSFPFTLVSMF